MTMTIFTTKNVLQEQFPIGSMISNYGRIGKVTGYCLTNDIQVNIYDYSNETSKTEFISPTELTLVRGDEEEKIEVVIIGRRWFQKSYGNTYHSVIVWVNGKSAGTNDFSYGYGDSFEQTGLNIASDYINIHYGFNLADNIWGREAQKVKIISLVSDVQRKKDLKF